ncbi:class I SAM-dependent methyltransferase [uncultured Friedmanniella sp.]|uniref:class I SAM-dependent methyltransferase n=1 Tax=uncultured Friedmanniella sp. TaxID=335381 RepID=UPI0035CB21F6
MTDHREVNRANWDERAPAHAASADYALQRFVDDPEHLSGVVSFDRPRLGDLTGLRGLHLQCHIGTDTLSLARLGAQMSGLDFSGPALAAARSLAERAGASITYYQAEVDDALAVAGAAAYDFVFTGIGALCWLPDVRRWAQTVAGLLVPGGRLFLREAHPVLWALAEQTGDGRLVVDLPYFEQPEPMRWDSDVTYVGTDVRLEHTVSYEWNHGLGEIVTALLDVGFTLTTLVEHDSLPWEALPGLMTVDERGEFRLIDRPERLPCSYTLHARLDRA